MDHSYVVHIENALHNLKINVFVQDRHLIPTPVDQTSLSSWLYKHPWITCQMISQALQ